jgi:hypothetical protein
MKGGGRGLINLQFRYFPRMSEENDENISEDIQYPGRVSRPGLLESEAAIITALQRVVESISLFGDRNLKHSGVIPEEGGFRTEKS